MNKRNIEKMLAREGKQLLAHKRGRILAACGVDVEGKENKECKAIAKRVTRPAAPARFGKSLRIAAIAACLALIIAAGAVGLPLMLENPETPPATEPMQGENTGEAEETNISDTTSKKEEVFDTANWVWVSSTPYAIIEIIEWTEETYKFHRKIKCNIIYSWNTDNNLKITNEGNANTVNEIYIDENYVKEIQDYSVILVPIYELGETKQGIAYGVQRDFSGKTIYLPIVDGKLVFDEIAENEKKYPNPLVYVNSQITIYSVMGEDNWGEIAKTFPKKLFATGLTIDEIIENFNALLKARDLVKNYW